MKPNGSPNRLINEKSPYLLQHAYNSVDWYPWGEEAFKKANKEDKPIFLSIGYSTCHWCHVMERESFEDEAVARLMNDAFINIKVDREERPDIDSSYMAVCQMLTGHGGWPLTIIMTPNKEPFFAGTYFPKQSRFGRYGMLELIPAIQAAWNYKRDELFENAQKITQHLNTENSYHQGEQLSEKTIQEAYQQFTQYFDEINGGFGTAPKFPTPHNLMLLMRYWKRTGEERALFMVEVTLQAMRKGGIFDHVGFGFHRYSTDQRWLLPHFEKMLYDQAMLMMAYTEAYQCTGKTEYRQTVEDIFEYIARDMTSPEGGFYSAEDADSEGEEGKFYIWTEDDIKSILSSVESDVIIKAYNVSKGGNFQDEATHKKMGVNILHLTENLNIIANEMQMSEKDLTEILGTAGKKLFQEREKRVRPYKDDKILCDWNGLLVAALAKAGQALNDIKYTNAAKKAVKFIFSNMLSNRGEVFHRYRDKHVAVDGFLDDYAFLTWGLIELYEATFEIEFLQKAIDMTEILLNHFWDKENGGFFLTNDNAESVLIRNKDIYDGAIPSGNSVAMLNLLRLGRITAKHEYEERAAQINAAFSLQVDNAPQGHSFFLCALDFAVGPSYEIVISGNRDAEDTILMLQALRKMFIPGKVVLFRAAQEENPSISRLAEFTKDLISQQGKATAYVCTNYNCQLPITETQKLLEQLN